MPGELRPALLFGRQVHRSSGKDLPLDMYSSVARLMLLI